MSSLFKIGVCLAAACLASCSSFYSRHYTKGVYLEGFSKKAVPDQLSTALKGRHSGGPIPNDTLEEKRDRIIQVTDDHRTTRITLTKQNRFQKPGKKGILSGNNITKKPLVSAERVLQKKFRGGTSSSSQAGKAALYILAILLALIIVALAIYFLPAVLIPAPVSSAFITLVIIAIIVVLAFFVLLIYSLFLHLIKLFKRKKTDPEDDF